MNECECASAIKGATACSIQYYFISKKFEIFLFTTKTFFYSFYITLKMEINSKQTRVISQLLNKNKNDIIFNKIQT
jgi:hypothetical protein